MTISAAATESGRRRDTAERVVHLVPALFDERDGVIGGAERYVYELARHMADVVPTRLVTFGTEDRTWRDGALSINVLGHPWYVRGQRFNPFRARIAAEVARCDVVHCHQQHIVASSVAAVAARLTGRRVFCTDLGGGGFDISTFVSTDGWYDGHLHISEYSRHVFGHDQRPGAHVIGGGVDTARFSPAPVPRSGHVVFVGRILPHKGIDGLIRALPADLPARVIGRAPDARYLADLQTLAAGKRVSFEHQVDDAGIVSAYRSALCVVLPSVYDDMYGQHTNVPELLGQTLLEGMACGTPGVCTNVASLPEIVRDGVTGFVVPAHDPDALGAVLTRLASDAALVERVGAAAAADVTARFSWPQVVQACLAHYRGERSAS